MTEDNIRAEIVKETIKEVAKDVYSDGGKPIVQPTGELIGLVPRAIKAALSPLEQWVLQREYNVAETKRLLEEKSKNTLPELIESPDPFIAVPALQYISYCMNNDELRDMYANLLANSMNKVVKNGVHPAYVEIIKQLSPDEAKILRYIYKNVYVPTIGLNVHKKTGGTLSFFESFTNITELCGCEDLQGYDKHIENLIRLGLIIPPDEEYLVDDEKYEPLKKHEFIVKNKLYLEQNENVSSVEYAKGLLKLTAFGKSFCYICLETQNTVAAEISESEDNDDQL